MVYLWILINLMPINDAGIYICADANSNDDDAVLNITAGKLLPFILYYIN